MKIGIMQPYFFPYIGYFQLIDAVDKWIVFDVVQYIERGWMNRNRILSPNIEKEWTYIVVPAKNHDRDELISEVRIDDASAWQDTIRGQLSYYKKIRAPYYEQTVALFDEITTTRFDTISDLNVQTLKRTCEYLGIVLNCEICSNMSMDFSNVKGPGDWAFEISTQMGADTYINPIGGVALFDNERFRDAGIQLKFLKPGNIEYRQSRRAFVPWLSIIDVMMFNSPGTIHGMLKDYELA